MTDVVFLILNSNLFSTPWSIYLDGELVRGKNSHFLRYVMTVQN